MSRISYTEALELACVILDLNEDDEDIAEQVEEKLVNIYEIELSSFMKLIDKLLPLATIGQSPLTKEWYRGFALGNAWIVKREIEQ